MNLYFLVEGETERQIYEKWVKHVFPHLNLVHRLKEVNSNTYYIVSGGGIPSILNHIKGSFIDIKNHGYFDHFFICLDSESVEYETRLSEVQSKVHDIQNEVAQNVSFSTHIIIQHCCIETWFLGHSKMLRRNPTSKTLVKFKNFYDVSVNNPEEMDYPSDYPTKAGFHLAYLREMLQEQNKSYSKTNPGIVKDISYFKGLQERCTKTSHLSKLKYLLEIWNGIN